ncbi:MAG: hypothetical protein QOJ98_3227 [Acidobacteriota bacterium]|jgi:hypothetical protein|nr:hypothetical protein [Acidobacteriota bacterium]
MRARPRAWIAELAVHNTEAQMNDVRNQLAMN